MQTEQLSRRERLRRELEQAIDDAAQAQLARVGPAALSLREIARDVGLSPAALYHYVDSRDALLTRLISRGFDDLADHLERATSADDAAGPATRLLRFGHAYRRWAIDNAPTFALVFGGPVAGYVAPEEGPTTVAIRRVATAFFRLMHEVRSIRSPTAMVARAPSDQLIATIAASENPLLRSEIPPAVLTTDVGLWGRMHGLVSLECFGHLRWLTDDGHDLFDAELRAALSELGIAD